MAITTDAFLVANCLRKCLSQRNPHVFNRMVSVDMQVAMGLNIQINQAMTRDLIQHVIQKRHACIKFLLTAAIEIDGDADLRFIGIAGYRRNAFN